MHTFFDAGRAPLLEVSSIMSDRIGSARCRVSFSPHASVDPIDVSSRESGHERVYLSSERGARRLDEEIRREARARFPDAIKLLRLKKLRLAVKDRLTRRYRDVVPA
jgi:hypothetical protein